MARSNNEFDSLESLLNKATSPLNRTDDWEFIMEFCDRINAELEGPQIGIRLLLHKIKSPQEKESLQGLTVLEACVKNCGEVFHNRLGRESVVNQLLQLVSSKRSLECHANENVRKKLITLLYTWSHSLPKQTRIKDAYQKLKRDGIVTIDPVVDPMLLTVICTKTKQARFFSDEEKQKRLQKLLNSKHPADVKEANLLIQSAVQEDEIKMERSRKVLEVKEEVENSVKLLDEMLAHYDVNNSSQQEAEIIKEIFESCKRLRPSLFKSVEQIADDADSDQNMVIDLLSANDRLTRVIQVYEAKCAGKDAARIVETSSAPGSSAQEQTTSTLIDFNFNSSPPVARNVPASTNNFADGALTSTGSKPPAVALASQDLSYLDLSPSSATVTDDFSAWVDDPSARLNVTTSESHVIEPSQSASTLLLPRTSPSTESVLNDLDLLAFNPTEDAAADQKLLDPIAEPSLFVAKNGVPEKQAVNLMDFAGDKIDKPPIDSLQSLLSPMQIPPPLKHLPPAPSLDNVFVQLQSIRPSNHLPVTVYDQNSVRVLLHFAKDHASPSRLDTLVSVISIISTRAEPVRDIFFQVAAPKTMKVKLQPPSCTELLPYNPIFSTPPLTQVMIIANPKKEEVMLRYKLDYKLNGTSVMESGIITGFPHPSQWGRL